MNKKSLATALALAGAVFAASAGPVVNPPETHTTIGIVGFGTDYIDGSVTRPVHDAFTDTYDFTLLVGEDVTASAQVLTNLKTKSYALTGNAGELQLYSGTFAVGSSLSSYTLIDQISFGTSGNDALVDQLAAGNYFLAVEGTTSGTSGGRYSLEVQAVPEPANAALLLAGLCLVGTLAKRRKTN